MNVSVNRSQSSEASTIRREARVAPNTTVKYRLVSGHMFLTLFDEMLDVVAPSPWVAHAGVSVVQREHRLMLLERDRRRRVSRPLLYTPEERERRDASPWTIVQAVLAPIQFLAFAISLGLVVKYMISGEGYQLATFSILVKTILLYAIMITGSIWEKQVFGKWLFARTFFWEDVLSMVVLFLQTLYLLALITGWATPREQMIIAITAYAAYVANAAQFLLKLRAARLERHPISGGASERFGLTA